MTNDIQHYKRVMTDIYTDEALQAKIFDLWDQGRTIGEIVIELQLDLDEFLQFFHYQGLI